MSRGTRPIKANKAEGKRYRGNKNKRIVGSKGAALKRRRKPSSKRH